MAICKSSRVLSLLLAGIIAIAVVSAPLRASAAADDAASDMLSRYIISYADSTGLLWSMAGGLTASAAVSLLSGGVVAEYAASIGTTAAALFTEVAAAALPVVGGVVLAASAVAIIVAIINYVLVHRGLSEPSASPVTGVIQSGLPRVTVGGTPFYYYQYSTTPSTIPSIAIPDTASPSFLDASALWEDIVDPVSYLWDPSTYANGWLTIPAATFVDSESRQTVYTYDVYLNGSTGPLEIYLKGSTNVDTVTQFVSPFSADLGDGTTRPSVLFSLSNGEVCWYNTYTRQSRPVDDYASPDLHLPLVMWSSTSAPRVNLLTYVGTATSSTSSSSGSYQFTNASLPFGRSNFTLYYDGFTSLTSAPDTSSAGDLSLTRPADYVNPAPVSSGEQVTLTLSGDMTDYSSASDAILALSDAVLVDGDHIDAVTSAAPVEIDWDQAPAVEDVYTDGVPSEAFPPDDPIGFGLFPGDVFLYIWHYVLEVIAYGSTGLEAIRSLWVSLPYASKLPLYASIVVTFVFGLLSRLLM